MPATFERYGCLWPGDCDDLMVEFACIQKGGQWKSKYGDTCGAGLFEHYRRAQSLMWPEDDHHRWSDLILREILSNTITAILGPKDSSKTYTASKYALTDYLVFPEKTLVIISSTDMRGLEMRVWGALKSLHERAKLLFPELAGHVLESKHAICTDDLEEDLVRDMRKGLLCVPSLSSQGAFVGVARYVGMKQERRRLIADECFPAGTMVDTPTGAKRIETIQPGDKILNCLGTDEVLGVRRSTARRLCRIITQDNRQIVCTPNHKFLTQMGWVNAVDITERHYMIGLYEAMSILQERVPAHIEQQGVPRLCGQSSIRQLHVLQSSVQKEIPQFDCSFLRSELCLKMEIDATGISEEVLHSKSGQENISSQIKMAPDASRLCFSKASFQQTHTPRAHFASVIERRVADLESSNSHWMELSPILSGRCGLASPKTYCRSRWKQPFQSPSSKEGFGKGSFFGGSWVARCEILKPGDTPQKGGSRVGVEVYNLHVKNHHSYSVNSLTCANCQFMREGFLDAPANMNSGDFKGIFLGNPLGMDDPLDKVSEPKTGWTSLPEPEKTAVWENRWLNGKTINLVGTDSPNFDPETKDKYKYLINQKSIDNTIAFYTKDSLQYYSQCKGVRRSGINAHRVITREMCEQFGAFDDVIWKGTPITKIAGCDAAYGGVGGDRCVAGHIEFGEDIDGKIVIACQPPVIVPVSIKKTERPEDQIAQFVMDYCSANEIPPENFFFDATGRGSLGTSLARIWSANTEPIEFGGVPTNRPVSLDFYVLDPKSRERRLKLCNEHYSKFVTELWFTVRYVIEARQLRQLPEDVAREGYMREWILTRGDKIEVEKKSDTKLRMNRSPDMFDWLVTCVEGARRRGFKISKLANEEESSYARDWLDDLSRKQRELIHRRDLVYR